MEFPQGSMGPVTLQKFAEFRVPAEGDLLSGSIPEGIGSYSGLSSKFPDSVVEKDPSPDVIIRSYPLLEPVTLASGIALLGSPAPENCFLARLSWNASWADTNIWGTTRRQMSQGEPGIREREIGGKRFHEIFVIYDKPSPPTKPARQYLHLRKDRAYILSFGGAIPPDVEQAVLESFTPTEVQRTREAMLLERALLLWTYERAIFPPFSLADSRTGAQFGCIPFNGCGHREAISEALHAVLRENPENYLAHLCLGIHHLSAGLRSFSPEEGLPEDVLHKDATIVVPKDDFDHYAFNPIWVYDRWYISAYLLRGDFEVKPAIVEFENALRIRPSSYAARYFLSWLYARTGEYDKAVATLHEIERISPGDRDARLLLVGIYQITGKQQEGKAVQEEWRRSLGRQGYYDALLQILGQALGEAIGMAISGGFHR